jgi:DNA mismatch endonuclease (patch repair protein)
MTLPPTPPPSAASPSMRSNRRRDTSPELRLRRALHAMGYRYRVDMRLDVAGRRIHADLVFTRARVAVFVDGCFWHGCSEHCRMPSDPSGYWHAKIRRNMERDRGANDVLTEAGWCVVRIWEHTPVENAVVQIRGTLSHRPVTNAIPVTKAD